MAHSTHRSGLSVCWKLGTTREMIGKAAKQPETSVPPDTDNPIGRKLKVSHLADESGAAV